MTDDKKEPKPVVRDMNNETVSGADYVYITPPGAKTGNSPKNAPSNAGEILKKIIIVLAICLALFLLDKKPSIPHNDQTPPAPVKELTPEELAQQEAANKKAEAERVAAQERRDQEARAEQKNNILKDVGAYELLLDGAIVDLKNGNVDHEDMQGLGATLEVVYGTAQSLQNAWDKKDVLAEADKSYLKSVETKLVSFQTRGLPRLRRAFKEQVATTLWVHDVSVKLEGAGNTQLTLIGYWFATNANIQAAHDQLAELLYKFRFKKVAFVTDDFTYHGSGYNLKTPADKVVAVYNDGFQELKAGQEKP